MKCSRSAATRQVAAVWIQQTPACLLQMWPRPRCGTGPHCWQNVNHSSHSSKAVQEAEILVRARLRKSELVDEPCVIKNCSVAVHVIRRTKLPIGGAGSAACDAVKIALPGPAHGVADAYVEGIRHKTEFVSYRSHGHIKNLTPNNPLFHWVLARRLQDLGMSDLAQKHFEQAGQAGSDAGKPNEG